MFGNLIPGGNFVKSVVTGGGVGGGLLGATTDAANAAVTGKQIQQIANDARNQVREIDEEMKQRTRRTELAIHTANQNIATEFSNAEKEITKKIQF